MVLLDFALDKGAHVDLDSSAATLGSYDFAQDKLCWQQGTPLRAGFIHRPKDHPTDEDLSARAHIAFIALLSTRISYKSILLLTMIKARESA